MGLSGVLSRYFGEYGGRHLVCGSASIRERQGRRRMGESPAAERSEQPGTQGA